MKKLFLLMALVLTPMFATASGAVENFQIRDNHYGEDQFRYFNFGNVRVGYGRFVDFVLTANTSMPARVDGWRLWGPGFGVQTNCPSILFPGQRCVFRVFFEPHYMGNYSGNLEIAAGNGRIFIDLFGRGVR